MATMTTDRDPFSLDPNATTEVVSERSQVQAPTGPPATEKQVAFLRSLLNDRDIETLSGNLYERAFDLSTDAEKFVGKREASDLIDALLKAPKVQNKTASTEPPEGIHLVVRDDGSYDIFKVQVAVHGSGRKYAKQLDKNTGEFGYVGRSPFGKLSDATLMTLEQAKEFGHLYGMCIKCGRTLTDENSIAMGIGPICAEGF